MMSRSPATRCFATACGRCGPFHRRRSPALRRGSSLLPDQTDENVLQRALRRLEVLEADAGAVEVLQERGDASALPLAIVGVDEVHAGGGECQVMRREFPRNDGEPLLQ